MTSVTTLPIVTRVPAAGVSLMIEPAGTVVLEAVESPSPRLSPAPMIAVLAAVCVRPTTFGTATFGRPDETTSDTALPTLTCVPLTGDGLMTDSAGTVVLVAVVTVPTTRPAFVIAVVAAVCVRPATPRTATRGQPSGNKRATALPTLTCVPLSGDWLITDPAGTAVLV